MNIKNYLKSKKDEIDKYLESIMPSENKYPSEFHKAMSYTLFAGGKRIRPILCIAAYSIFKKDYKKCFPYAAALEIIHTYSLIHDDLPAMDNDTVRRGKPSNHIVFGEAKAILAADALLTFAFETMSGVSNIKPKVVQKAIHNISKASGYSGIVGGQFVDIDKEGQNEDIDIPTLEYIHTHKTGELLKASVTTGAILADATDEEYKHINNFGKWLGLTFQIIDDILDEIGDENKLGKKIGQDSINNKFTYPAIYGIKKSKEIAKKYTKKSISFLEQIDKDTSILENISNFLLKRTY